MTALAVAAALALAFANGANDNAKGVATLIGGHAVSARAAPWYAAVTTLLGSLADSACRWSASRSPSANFLLHAASRTR